MQEIEALFKQRDDAVACDDPERFLATQIRDISNASVSGYLSQRRLVSEVLATADDGELVKVAFVRETYVQNTVEQRHAFLIYSLVNTIRGWKIYNVAH